MKRTQVRVRRWMTALSLATATAVPASGQDWLSDEDTGRSVVSDSTVELVDPPSPEGFADGGAPASAGPIRTEGTATTPYEGTPVADEGGTWDSVTGWVADACSYPRDQGPFQQPGLLQVLHDNKCATWTFRSDALLLWRNAPQGLPIYSDLNATTPNGFGATALDASQMQSTPAAGPRFSIFRTDDCDNAWEYTWFKAANFRSQEATLPTVNGYGMTPPGIFGNLYQPVDTAVSDLSASIWSFELNRWSRWTPNIAFIHGYRMLGWGENLSLVDHYQPDPANPSPIYGQDIFGSRTYNSLYGYQIGTDIRLWDRGGWIKVDGILKGGAYYNNAVQTSSYTYQTSAPGGVPETWETSVVRAAGGSAAFVGEVGMTGTIPLSQNIALRVGYLGLWLQGLAQPTNQLRGQTITSGGMGTPTAATLNTIGSTVVQGVTLGLEGRW